MSCEENDCPGAKVKPKFNAYAIISEAISGGILSGLRRATKHTNEPSQEQLFDALHHALMLCLDEVMDFEDSEPSEYCQGTCACDCSAPDDECCESSGESDSGAMGDPDEPDGDEPDDEHGTTDENPVGSK